MEIWCEQTPTRREKLVFLDQKYDDRQMKRIDYNEEDDRPRIGQQGSPRVEGKKCIMTYIMRSICIRYYGESR